MPTPQGPITVRWRKNNADHDRDVDSFVLTISTPRGTTGTVAVPLLGGRRVIAEDGRVVHGHVAGRYARFGAGPGTHTYAWSCGRC